MGSSARKEKKKYFQKPKYKVGKPKAKPSNFTDTSFKSKSIVIGQQSLTADAPEATQQFQHNLSLASSKSDKQRRDALAFLTGQLSATPPVNPVGTYTLLSKLLPLISDPSNAVRAQLLKLLRALPPTDIRYCVEHALLYVRAGMTHLSSDISNDALAVIEWLFDCAQDELVRCPGGWTRTLNSMCASMGWATSSSNSGGWTAGTRPGLKPKDAQTLSRQINALSRLVTAGLKKEVDQGASASDYWDCLYQLPKDPACFEYLDLCNDRRDEDTDILANRDARQHVFFRKFLDPVTKGVGSAKREGGTTGRAASILEKVVLDGMRDFEPNTVMESQDLLDLW